MTISSRAQAIIRQLQRDNRYVTVENIAQKMNLTPRTVYRELADVNQVLASCGIELETVTGKGMKILAPPENMKKLNALLNNLSNDSYSTSNRLAIILFYLLKANDYIKAQTLAIESKTSIQTVRNDLKIIEKSLHKENLVLNIKKREGVKIDGTIVDKSHYLVKILAQCIDIDIFFNWIMDGKDVGQPLLMLLNQYGYLSIIEKLFTIILRIIKINDIKVNDNNIRDVLLLLAIFIEQQKNGITYSGWTLRADVHHKKESYILDFITSLQNIFAIDLNAQEKDYLNWIIHTFIQPKKRKIQLKNVALINQIAFFISEIEKRLGVPLNVDSRLSSSLYAHVDRMLTRLRSGIVISNPVNKEIKQQHPDLFKIVQKCAETVFVDIVFPTEEIGYLVLYIMAMLDRIAAKSFSVLVVCTSGLGSSKLLTSRLEREIAEIKIKKQISLIDFYSEDIDDYDLILSTIPLYLENDQYIMVSPLLTEDDAIQIKRRIRHHRIKTLSTVISKRQATRMANVPSSSLALLYETNGISKLGIEMLNNIKFLSNLGLQTNLVKGIGSYFYRIGMQNDPDFLSKYDEINNSCFVIPNSKMAYAELCIKEATSPIILTVKLDEAKTYSFGVNELSNINTVLILFYPYFEEAYLMDFLHDIPLMIIEDSQSIKIFESGNPKSVRVLLENRFAQYLAQHFIQQEEEN